MQQSSPEWYGTPNPIEKSLSMIRVTDIIRILTPWKTNMDPENPLVGRGAYTLPGGQDVRVVSFSGVSTTCPPCFSGSWPSSTSFWCRGANLLQCRGATFDRWIDGRPRAATRARESWANEEEDVSFDVVCVFGRGLEELPRTSQQPAR